MEELVGALIEIFGELIIEIIAHVIGAIAGSFDYELETNPVFKKRVKYIITYVFYGLAIVLFGLSLFYHKTTMTIIAVSYLMTLSLLNICKFINNNNFDNKSFKLVIVIIRRIVYYTFPILCIIFGAKTLTNESAIIWLCVLSSVALLVYLIVDIRRIVKYYKKKHNLQRPLEYWEEIEEFNT